MTGKQQAVYRLQAQTGVDQLKLSTEDIPSAGPHEVVLEIKAVSLNFRDLAIATGKYPFPVKDNVIPVSDCAAIVHEVGPRVKGFAVGDKVVVSFDGTNLYGQQKDWNNGHGGPVDGFLRHFAAVQESMVVKVPKGKVELSFAELATLVCTGVTSWNALYGVQPTKPGDVILCQGIGGVSMTILLLAKAAGCTVIVTSSSDKKLQFVQDRYGADHIINYKKTPAWGAEAVRLNNGRGVDFVVENGGSGLISESFEALAMGGKIAVIGFLSVAEQKDMPDVAMMALNKGAVVRGITVGPKSMLEDLVQFVTSRGLRPPVDKVFKFEEAVEAYEYLTKSGHIGKICIEM